MRVPIYKLQDAQEKIAAYFVWDGQQVRVEPDAPDLRYYATKPYSLVVNGERKQFSPKKNPEEWMKWLHLGLNGSYLWAGELE